MQLRIVFFSLCLCNFVDYAETFDMVSHLKLFKVLLEMGIPKHLVAVVQEFYAQQTAKVRWDRESSEAFTIGRCGMLLFVIDFCKCLQCDSRRGVSNCQQTFLVMHHDTRSPTSVQCRSNYLLYRTARRCQQQQQLRGKKHCPGSVRPALVIYIHIRPQLNNGAIVTNYCIHF